MGAIMKITVFWDVMLYSFVGICQITKRHIPEGNDLFTVTAVITTAYPMSTEFLFRTSYVRISAPDSGLS
jgi:hypothetical protein